MNVLFLHIPKNAGTSIRNCLSSESKFNYPFWMKNHLYLNILEKRCEYYNFIPDYKFCVVRNPYTRILSIYNHIISNQSIYIQKMSNKWGIHHTHKKDYDNNIKLKFDEWLSYFFYESKVTSKSDMLPQQSIFINGTKDIEIFKFEDLSKLENKLKIKLPNKNVGNYNKSIKISQKNENNKEEKWNFQTEYEKKLEWDFRDHMKNSETVRCEKTELLD